MDYDVTIRRTRIQVEEVTLHMMGISSMQKAIEEGEDYEYDNLNWKIVDQVEREGVVRVEQVGE